MRSPTAAYNAERNRRELSGDLYPGPQNQVERLPDADADAVSPLWALVECVRWLQANGRKERERGWLLAQQLVALESEVDAFMEDVGYVAPKPPDIDAWDEDDEPHTDRHLWGI